jgi:Xaa-Pro aminopeptidase
LTVLDLDGLARCDVAGRLPRLRERLLALDGVDAFLVCRLPNIRYLTGFTGSAALLLVRTDGESVFVSDGRYATQAGEQLSAYGVAARIEIRTAAREQLDVLAAALGGTGRVALEEHGVTWDQAREYGEQFAPVECVPGGQQVEVLRRSKDPGEIDRIRAACAIADDAFAEMLPRLVAGISERDFALELEFAMRRRGATGVSFDPIVASGPNAAKPHARPTDRTIERGELIVCDFGCVVDGYCSDMTRTVSVGEPSIDAQRLWDLVYTAQAAGRAAVRVGADVTDIDAACRDVISDAGYADAFSHGTGHGVGIEIHESPRVAKTASGTLVDGDIVTVEPGVYLPGVGGVRIEDTVLVTPDGYEPLTLSPKTLVI